MAIKITECPRDAMQGLHEFVPTDVKAEYINLLLKVGFDVIDFGSFVSPKAIPQMRDTAEVLSKLDLSSSSSKLLAIIANCRGAEDAAQHEDITYLGYPFSISETFQLRNTNATIGQAFENVQQINELCQRTGKKLLVYLSMGFGNPYGDEWNNDLVVNWANKLVAEGVGHIALADTIGIAEPAQISELYKLLTNEVKDAELGIHLHSAPHNWREKIEAALDAGCTSFDTALRGYGGCPMAKDELTGNIATENVISLLQERGIESKIDMRALQDALAYSTKVFAQA